MNSQKISCQERLSQDDDLVDDYGSKDVICLYPQFGAQKKSYQMGFSETESQQNSVVDWVNSSSSIMSSVGSPSPAFYATELYMGLPQFDRQVHDLTFAPEISKNYDARFASYQQTGNGVYTKPLEQPNSKNLSFQSAGEGDSCSYQYSSASGKSYSESDQIVQLKRKLLGDYYPPNNKRQVSIPFYGNGSINISHNSYADQLIHMRESARTCCNAAAAASSKKRIRWSQDLHNRFVECVDRLGGAEKATPKAILKLMDCDRLTVYHVKSHLQKYRMAKYMTDSAEEKSDNRIIANSLEKHIDIKNDMQLKEALQLQLDVQKLLHEQLEIQGNLQLRIEEQGKQLKLMFEQQQKRNKCILENQNSNIKFVDGPSGTGVEHMQDFISQESENSRCPSKIS